MRYSFGLLKPDCLERDLVEKAFELIQSRGLKIIYSRQIRLNKRDVEFLYSRCRQSDFFENLINFMTSGNVIIYLVKSVDKKDNAIRILNSVTGFTDPSRSKKKTLRSLGENVQYFINNQHVAWTQIEFEPFLKNMDIKKIETDFTKKLNSYENKWDSDSRILHLVEEVGEFAEIILQYKGVKQPQKDLRDIKIALADIVDDVFAIAILNKIPLEDLIKEVLKKDE